MAEVFLARLPGPSGFQKMLVVKKLLPHLSTDPRMVDMFVAEATLAARVQHKNIVQVFEFDRIESGEYILAMEYVHGTDLRNVLALGERKGLRIPPWFSVFVMTEVLEGLAFAHELTDENGTPHQIVHRDLTPSNIFISLLGEVKLGDFGVARDMTLPSTTRHGEVKGKLTYMSPEQARGKEVDQRSDLFSAGVVLWECLSQRRLFKADSELDTMLAITQGSRVPPSNHVTDVPEALDQVVLEALATQPDDRVPTAREMLFRLREVLRALRPRLVPQDVSGFMRSLAQGSAEVLPLKAVRVRAGVTRSMQAFDTSSGASAPADEEVDALHSDDLIVVEARLSSIPPPAPHETIPVPQLVPQPRLATPEGVAQEARPLPEAALPASAKVEVSESSIQNLVLQSRRSSRGVVLAALAIGASVSLAAWLGLRSRELEPTPPRPSSVGVSAPARAEREDDRVERPSTVVNEVAAAAPPQPAPPEPLPPAPPPPEQSAPDPASAKRRVERSPRRSPAARAPTPAPAPRSTEPTAAPAPAALEPTRAPAPAAEGSSLPPLPAPETEAPAPAAAAVTEARSPEPAPSPKPAPKPPAPASSGAITRASIPPADQASFDLTSARCGKCHPSAQVFEALRAGKTPITGRAFESEQIKQQVIRCTRLPHSNISKEDAREILGFLVRTRGRAKPQR